MIHRNTSLVLGAGASAPFGFPLGRALLLHVSRELGHEQNVLFRQVKSLGFEDEHLKDFGQSLNLSMQPSVDAFLENRAEYLDAGKAAMAASLIPYEKSDTLVRTAAGLSWYEYLFNEICTGSVNSSLDRLFIVTFNYDRSLEYFLWSAFAHSFGLKKEEAAKLVREMHIVHVYGQLGEPAFLEGKGRHYEPEVTQEALRECAAEIRIIHEAPAKTKEIEQARLFIGESEVLCFLGFGYHHANLQRLNLDGFFHGKSILGSGWQLLADERRRVRNRFGKHASDLKLGRVIEDNLLFLRNNPVFD